MTDVWTGLLCVSLPGIPLTLLAVLGARLLVERPPAEQRTGTWVGWTTLAGLIVATCLLVLVQTRYGGRLTWALGDWVVVPEYHVRLKLLFDALSLPFVMLSFVLCGTIGAFATKYLHREPGYHRFFVLYALFVAGMVVTALAGTVETLFIGWEAVGLSSALLVAFFHERTAPVRNGLRIWSIYRISDAALVLAAVVLHHLHGEGDFNAVLGSQAWPHGTTDLTAAQALVVGMLLLVAAAGKSALVPFSGWLPRAMEGPTPSSAVFYGALSVHLGAFLLLRMGPILDRSPLLQWAVVALGTVTAVYAALAARVQTDVKCGLSFASLTQVGIIVAEIGVGLRYAALAHIIGHACLRALQFLRAPTLLQDYHSLENAIGDHLPADDRAQNERLPARWRILFYRFGLERGYLDACLHDYLARPILGFFRFCDRLERRWTDALAGGDSRESDQVRASTGLLDEP
ncbi:MAG: proton-conducting transporter transmembrane domain-containing protein [Planctomycetaceae bacterium]